MKIRSFLIAGLAIVGLGAGPAVAVGDVATRAPVGAVLHNASFAGYQVSKPNRKVTEASAVFVVPTIKCKKNFSGVGPSVIVQSRPDKRGAVSQSGAGVGVACQNKRPTYQAVVIVHGNETNDYVLTPGEHVQATVRMSAASTTVDIHDLTSGNDKSVNGRGSIGTIALVGDSGLSFGATSVGIDPFTKTRFTAAKVNRKPIGKVGAVAVQRTHGSTVQIAVGRLRRDQNFVLRFKNSR